MFSWSRRKSESHSHHDKDKQLKELKSVFPSITRPNNDDSLFSIQFVVDGKYSSLKIFIPNDFPLTRPVLQAAGPVKHPWLDQFKQVNGCEKLMNWTKHSSLTEVVEESIAALLTGTNGAPHYSGIPNIEAQLDGTGAPLAAMVGTTAVTSSSSAVASAQAQPTSVFSYPGAGSNSYPITQPLQHPQTQSQQYDLNGTSSRYDNVGTRHMSIQNPTTQPMHANYQPQPPHRSMSETAVPTTLKRELSAGSPRTPMNLPGLPSSFPKLETLDVVQLERLLNDDIALEVHVMATESIVSMQSLLDSQRMTNLDAVRRNLALGEELHVLEREVTKQQDELKSKLQQYSEDVSIAGGRFYYPLEQLHAELKRVCSESDETSDQIGKNFVEGNKDVPAFVDEFLEQRTKYHELCAKMKILPTS